MVAGGTGGHIYPAISIINKIKKMEPGSEILYIGTTDRMEKDIVPKLGIKYVGIEMSGLNRSNLLSNFNVLGPTPFISSKFITITHSKYNTF